MSAKRRPRVTLRCVADKYAGPRERIIEFFSDRLQCGGLIAFREDERGLLVVEPHCYDINVVVHDTPDKIGRRRRLAGGKECKP